MSEDQFHSIAVDGFILTGEDDFGCAWTVEQASGWFTPDGALRTATESRGQQAGSQRGPAYQSGRVITLRGKVFAPSTTDLEMAGRRLSALLPRGAFGEVVGESEAGTYASVVQLDELPLFDPLSDRGAAYQVVLGSEDPLLYGPTWFGTATLASTAAGVGRLWSRAWPRDWGVPAGVTPGAIAVPNAGTAPYWTRLRIDGPVTNPVVRAQETGDSIRLIQPDGEDVAIVSGQWFDLDTGARHVTFGANANDVRYLADVSGAWLAVPPGGVTFTFEADAGTSETTLTVFGYEGAWS